MTIVKARCQTLTTSLLSRGDWTSIELFATGAGELSGQIRAMVLAAQTMAI